MLHQSSFIVATAARGTLEITDDVQDIVAASGIRAGLATVFIHHTSASLIVTENADPDVQLDLDAWLGRAVADGDALFRHVAEGPDDMAAHVRTVLTASSIGLPLAAGRLDLGTWQGLFVYEHRRSAHRRRVSVTIVGG